MPTGWLLLPQPNTAPATPGDIAFGCVFLIPQVLAFSLSAVLHPAGRTLTVLFASLGLVLAVLAVPLYLIGVPFLPQAVAAAVIATRRAG